MSAARSLALVLLAVLLVSPVIAYSGEGSVESEGGEIDGSNPYCTSNLDDEKCNEDPENWDNPPECSDGEDNNGLWGTDYKQEMWDGDDDYAGDPGCSSPYDDTEAVLWDTDLTATVNNLDGGTPSLNQDPTVFFNGEIRAGIDEGSVSSVNGDPMDISFGDKIESGEVMERSLAQSSPETGDGKYTDTGLGNSPDTNSQVSYYSDLPTGTVITSNNRVIDPPFDPDDASYDEIIGGVDAAVTCGEGKLNDGYNGFGDIDPGSEDLASNLGCEKDYGVLNKRYDDSPVYDSGSFESTDGDCDDTSGSSTPSDGTEWYEARGDRIIAHYWYDYEEEDDCSGPGEEENMEDITYYEHREEVAKNCNSENWVRGGGGQMRLPGTPDKPDNDPAATFTDMTAYGDSSNSMVWCQFDTTLTVDADGPSGNGDGFVVIEDGQRVVGTVSPDGTDSVGQEVHYRRDGGSLQESSNSYLNRVSLSCPETSSGDERANYCIKYVDFYTAGTGSGWSSIGGAVKADVMTINGNEGITPDESYSACKFINMVAQDSNDQEVLECDYEASKLGSGDMSPLDQACGDQDRERLVMAEGKQLDFPVLAQELYQSQACVKYGTDKDTTGVTKPDSDDVRTLTENACVLGGVGYAEGTVIDVANYGKDVERGTYSPDFEVCLNPGIEDADRVKWDNNRNQGPFRLSEDTGGEWYDLDDEEVREYVRNNFNKDAYSSRPPEDQPVKRVETYMRNNTNPQHDEYNPTGGETGLVLEDDCGIDREFAGVSIELVCEDETSSGGENLFYSFFAKRLGG